MTNESEEISVLAQTCLASIVWPLRTPKENTNYVEDFALHIRNKFHEPSPTKYSRELNEFSNLRNIAISNLNENSLRDANSLKSLKKYYCQLVSMLGRFKDCGAEFTWKDAFGRGTNNGNLEFELNNIIYDIAAIHNEFGSRIARTNESTTKEACIHYNNASWWITELRDNRIGLKPKEMGHDLLTFFFHVLQAQAQECVLLHSLRAKMRLDNVAKIAAQIASDYDVALKLAYSPLYNDPIKEIVSGPSMFTSWRMTVEFKSRYFQAMTQLLLGLSFSDDSVKEIGTRIARLKMASQTLEQCRKYVTETIDSQTTKCVFAVIESLVTRKLDKAIRYNDQVYHATIPSRETLAQPEAKLVVSAVPFSISSIPEFKDLFSGIVTIETVQVSSIYSEKKDSLARQINSQVEKQDKELAEMMSTLNFDKRNLRLPAVEAPDELIEICAELSMSPNIVDDVLTKLEELDDKSEEIQKMLDSAQEMLRKRPNAKFQEELSRFKKTQEDALRTTQSLHKQLYPELQRKIQLMATTNDPSQLLPKLDSTLSSGDDEVVKKLEKLIDKVDEMKQQRYSLLAQLKQSLDNDDVIKFVVAATSELELKEVFEKEIQKHNKFLAPLQSNLKLQNEILDTLERVSAQYGQVKLNQRTQRAAYSERVESLKKYYAQFKTLSDGIEDGLKYHSSMINYVRDFYSKVQATNDLNDLLN